MRAKSWKQVAVELGGDNARLQARVEELEGGLRPFADLWASDDPPVIRVRDLERAHALLTTTEEARGAE